ncbi:MAG: hypothetical protein PWP34_422 [Desulfuromonadales bacterium]|nr:hypothetical protein [Desulfuromonadales bacterium]
MKRPATRPGISVPTPRISPTLPPFWAGREPAIWVRRYLSMVSPGTASHVLKRVLPLMMTILLLCGNLSTARAAWISDEIAVTLRRGPGNQYKILKSLASPARIEIIEDGESYFKVRAADGTEGFILKQYVTRQEPHAVISARLQNEQTVLQKKMAELTEKNQELQALQDETRTMLQRTEAELQKVRGEYEQLREGAENITETIAERDRLQRENQQHLQKIAALKEENRYLWRNNILRWFFAGVGVLWLGWFLGRRPPRRTRSF